MSDIGLLTTLENIQKTVPQVAERLLRQQRILATAESCTGGGIAYFLTNLAGSSQWFERAYVTYSNQAKQDMLGVSAAVLETLGAVSEAVVEQMARGALDAADISVAVSGIAGPTGGTAQKPVGMVCFAWALKSDDQIQCHRETQHFSGDRQHIRLCTIEHALNGILKVLDLS